MTRRQTGTMDPVNLPAERCFQLLGRIIAVLELGAQASTSQLVDYQTPNN